MRNRALIVIAAALVLLTSAMTASAQLRLDMDINVPIYAGYSGGGVQQGAWNQFVIPFPDAQLSYQLPVGPVRIGAGVRVFTIIIENFLYPEAYVELDLDPFVVSASVGGLAILEFGLLTGILTSAGSTNLTGFHSIIFPDLNVSYKVNDWLRITGGMFVIAPFTNTISGILGNNVFAGYVSAKFVALFK